MTTLVDAPVRVDGVQLIGEMVGSGYRTPPALVRRGDGQVLQLTPLLYLVLNAVDGRRSCAEIADLVSRGLGRRVTGEDVATLVDGHLRPVGLLKRADGSEPELKRSNPLLALRPRVAVTDERTTQRLTDPFRFLFHPLVAALVTVCFVVVVGWVFFERGLAASAYDAFERPHLLLLVFGVSVLSAGFHEFGHAAAARYSGSQPGAMGAGFYLVWPAFYTDVTDSYRLPRAGRIRTDVGGLYFNAVVVVLTFAWWWWSGWEALLLLVATQVLQMVQQMLPLLRFDGYHVLADLAGVPDLYQRIRPTLLGLLPHRWRSPENRMLTPWARSVITLWVLVTLPLMGLMLFALLQAVPRLLGSAGSVLQEDASAVGDAWGGGNPVDVTAHALQLLAVVLPLVACALVLGRIGLRFFRGLARWSEGSMPRRAAAAVLSLAVVMTLSWAWWPDPYAYRPITPDERGLVTNLLPAAQTSQVREPATAATSTVGRTVPGAAARDRLSGDQPLVAVFPQDEQLPTEDAPVPALVLVPTDGTTGTTGTAGDAGDAGLSPGTEVAPTGPATAPGGELADAWVLPFDKPLPPEEGDNQALAVATEDGSMRYDLAFALVWAEGDEVLNVNEAHAYASCSNCVAVAVAFQVILIVDDAQVVVPQNLAVAANYDCYRCITAALASQLVLSVDGEPGEEELRALGEVWDRLTRFAGSIASYSLTEISEQLESFKSEIVAILGSAPAVEGSASDATTAPDGPTDTSSSTSPSATASPSAVPATGVPTSAPTTSAEPAPSGSSTTEPSTQPTTGASGTPSQAETGTVAPGGDDVGSSPSASS